MIGYAVLGGFVLDAIFGDPAWLPHPVVYMGKAISALEKGLRLIEQFLRDNRLVPACPKRRRASFGAGVS